MDNKSGKTQEIPVVLNLSDLYLYYAYDEENYTAWLDGTECSRFYLGSYFCPKYFLQSLGRATDEIVQYAEEREYAISLAVPVTSDQWTEPVKKRLSQYLVSQNPVDEVIVNDYGMLAYVEELRKQNEGSFRITAGRLFFKNYRDPRYQHQQQGTTLCFFPQILKDRVDAVELDMCSEDMDVSLIPEEIAIHYHYPFSYVTCTQYCEFASGTEENPRKFRKEMRCGLNCMDAAIRTYADGADLLHVGKAVYSRSPEPFHSSREADRYIYWPFDELMEMEGGLR